MTQVLNPLQSQTAGQYLQELAFCWPLYFLWVPGQSIWIPAIQSLRFACGHGSEKTFTDHICFNVLAIRQKHQSCSLPLKDLYRTYSSKSVPSIMFQHFHRWASCSHSGWVIFMGAGLHWTGLSLSFLLITKTLTCFWGPLKLIISVDPRKMTFLCIPPLFTSCLWNNPIRPLIICFYSHSLILELTITLRRDSGLVPSNCSTRKKLAQLISYSSTWEIKYPNFTLA